MRVLKVDVSLKCEEPHAFVQAEQQVHRPEAQTVDGAFDGPIAERLPSKVKEVEADDQQDEKPHVHKALVLRVLEVRLELVYVTLCGHRVLRCRVEWNCNNSNFFYPMRIIRGFPLIL